MTERNRPPEVTVTIERRYAIDIDRIMRDFKKEIEEDVASGRSLSDVLAETFYELCGTWRDEDHVDGKYIWLMDSDAEFDAWGTWDAIVARAGGDPDGR